MNGTPRLRSAFPSTPQSNTKNDAQNASTTAFSAASSSIRSPTTSGGDNNAPLIPASVLDAPSQRLYVAFFYLGLTVWRFYDYFTLLSDETESLWLFMKWVAIDSAVLYGLPGLRVPWLQWSSSTTTLLFVCHGILNAILMFRVPIPLQAWLVAFTRILYDRELAVSERSVKPASVLHNASLILGKQIIHILPEGSAILNPDKTPFCMGNPKTPILLPLQINQTNPMLIELLHLPLEGNANATITIRGKELSKYKKHAAKEVGKAESSVPRTLKIPVKDTGLYRLEKVIDESELEVRRPSSDTLVVDCPSASVTGVGKEKCDNDLSDFEMVVHGVPPLKLKYSKTVNREDSGHTSLTITSPKVAMSPEDGISGNAMVMVKSTTFPDIQWARSQSIRVPINESLSKRGGWEYTIHEVEDANGNTMSYPHSDAEQTHARKSLEGKNLGYAFNVRDRPGAHIHPYGAMYGIKVPKGAKRVLPLDIVSPGLHWSHKAVHYLTYRFTPIDEVGQNQEHSKDAVTVAFVVRGAEPDIEISQPGLYSLTSIRSDFCKGEIMEPSKCLLLNPPEPDVVMKHTVIPDRCDGKSVGLSVDLELTGTPPFRVGYSVQRDGSREIRHNEDFDRHHGHIDLRPSVAGHYTYRFNSISDDVYREPRLLQNAASTLEQDIIPPASARFVDAGSYRKVCIGEPVSAMVEISGEGAPFVLEYEILHDGGRRKREKKRVDDVQTPSHTITTDELKDGGTYTLALISIADSTGCKTPLSNEVIVDVALQRPKASFAQVEGKRSLMALEDRKIELPLRLQGSFPWHLSYGNLDTSDSNSVTVYDANDKLTVRSPGTYEINSVHDESCPGSVDPLANKFTVKWIPRPAMAIKEGDTISRELSATESPQYVKRAVCEGDEDATDITLTGTPPFSLTYEQRHKPSRGSYSSISRPINAGVHAATIRMETSAAGDYDYEFSKLGDYSYNHDPRKFNPITLKQQVHSRPSARFLAAGKTYRYCKEEQPSDERIPISLEGASPFDIDIEVKHHALRKPERIPLRNIEANADPKKRGDYMLQIPHKYLSLGNNVVTARRVADANGCQRVMDLDAPHVQISVADVPTISPLEDQTDYCVGDRIGYTLAGAPPFNVYYTFQGYDRKASAPTTNFRRLAEKPGEFTIYGISDQKSTDACKANIHLTKTIHEMPSVRVSKGRIVTTDIHEGGQAEILFEFGGTPPFEFVYTRSSNSAKGKKSQVLETKSEISYEHAMKVLASDEGVYEVVSIKDRYCSFSTQKVAGKSGGQKVLQYH